MRRFRSNLTALQRVQHQLLRVAELRLAQAHSHVRQIDEAIVQLQEIQDEAGRSFSLKFQARQLKDGRQIQAAQDRLTSLAADIEDAQKQRIERQSEVAQREELYRQLKARTDGVDQVVERQQMTHRREQLQQEQNQIDEAVQLRRSPVVVAAGFQDEGIAR